MRTDAFFHHGFILGGLTAKLFGPKRQERPVAQANFKREALRLIAGEKYQI
jgi:hypothetical protein